MSKECRACEGDGNVHNHRMERRITMTLEQVRTLKVGDHIRVTSSMRRAKDNLIDLQVYIARITVRTANYCDYEFVRMVRSKNVLHQATGGGFSRHMAQSGVALERGRLRSLRRE